MIRSFPVLPFLEELMRQYLRVSYCLGRTKRLIQVIGLPLLVISYNGLLPSMGHSALANQVIKHTRTERSERIDKGEFYYSGGEKIPLVRYKNLFAVKFKGEEALSSLSSILKRNKGLKLAESSKFFEARKIHLLESCDEGDGIIGCLIDDPELEYAMPVFVTGADEPLVMSDSFVARFVDKLSREEIDEINAKNGVEIVKSIGVNSNVYVLRVTGLKDRTTLDVANGYYQMDVVEWSHPDWIRRMELRYMPNDPLFPLQWHLNNTGADVDAPEAWDLTKGDEEIIVAIIDDGVETTHEDFAGKVLPGVDVVNDTDNPNPRSGDNHGTSVAGLAVANQDNSGIGISGVAPKCKLMPIRLLAGGMTVSDEAEAFIFAADNGADVISNSWGPPDGTGNVDPLPDVLRAAIDYAADNGRGGKGCVIFFAAGNGNESVDNDGYASYEKVIAVGASTDYDERASYSDYGASLDIMAPSSGGTNGITTTDRMGSDGVSSGNYTNGFGGTSAASPVAAGVAALMLSVNGALSRGDVQEILQYTADKINPADANYDASGFSQKYGYGRINAYNAVLEAMNPNSPPKVAIQSPPEDFIIIHTDETVYFDGNATDRENAIVSYHWDLNGGVPDAYVEDPGAIAFNIPGTFFVTFTVTDSGGKQSSDSMKILVIEPEENVVSYRVDSTDTPISIPDNRPAGISSDVLLGRGKAIVEVNVSVNITHPFIGDLVVSIQSPMGTRVKLHNRSGSVSDNLITTYDTLTLPTESLNAFAGENPQGVWTLHVSDNVAADAGTLNGWQLEVVAIDGEGNPDLIVTEMKTKQKGKKAIVIDTTIKNQGVIKSDAFEVAFFLSSDDTLDTDDINLQTVRVDGMPSEDMLQQKITLKIPRFVSKGRYYLIVDVDSTNLISESVETNNYLVSQRTIRIR